MDGQLTGLAASSFTSVSLEPPLVSFSVANTSKTWPDLRRAAHLGLTVLADHHGEVCRRLAGPVEHRFDDVAVTASDDGAVTLDEGLARFDCTVYREVEAGDHTIVLLQLHAVEHTRHLTAAGLPPQRVRTAVRARLRLLVPPRPAPGRGGTRSARLDPCGYSSWVVGSPG